MIRISVVTNFRCFTSVLFALALLVRPAGQAFGWGNTAHVIINRNAVMHLPAGMAQLAAQESYLAAHASDADYRKSADTAEYPKHFLDIDVYPDFHLLPSDLQVLIRQHGWTAVRENGILPWATVWAVDSLIAQARRGDWVKAWQTAADIGHYVGDSFMPLHCTVNYDGQYTGNRGIHSRYESSMINTYTSALVVTPGRTERVTDPYAYMLSHIIRSNGLVDSVLHADTRAKAASGGAYSSTYYASLWADTDTMTIRLIQDATVVLASLWQYAWEQAGLLEPTAVEVAAGEPFRMELMQNYPNPFNSTTTIPFAVTGPGLVRLSIHTLLGQEVQVLFDGPVATGGTHHLRFHADRLATGAYLYRLRTPAGTRSGRLMLIR